MSDHATPPHADVGQQAPLLTAPGCSDGVRKIRLALHNMAGRSTVTFEPLSFFSSIHEYEPLQVEEV
jgi:hypothetical protein